MKIYLKDGTQVSILDERPDRLVADFGAIEGYVNIKKMIGTPDKSYRTLATISEENLSFIEYDRTNKDETATITVTYRE